MLFVLKKICKLYLLCVFRRFDLLLLGVIKLVLHGWLCIHCFIILIINKA